jgi:hypothetical protein
LVESSCVISLVSPASAQSTWVRDETKFAELAGKSLPVVVEPTKTWLGTIQAADLSYWSGDPAAPEFQRLLAAIERIAGPPRARAEEGLAMAEAAETGSSRLPEALRPLSARVAEWTRTEIVVTEHAALLADPLPPAPLALLDLADLYEGYLTDRMTPADKPLQAAAAQSAAPRSAPVRTDRAPRA